MKRTILFSILCFVFCTTQAQITYEDFSPGLVIHQGDNFGFDLNKDGQDDFHINKQVGKVGFWPVFNVGCWASQSTVLNTLGTQDITTYHEGDQIMMTQTTMFTYIDYEPGLIYTDYAGLINSWVPDKYYYVGFGVFSTPDQSRVIDGWMQVKFDSNLNALVIKDMAYTEANHFIYQDGIKAGEKGATNTFDLIEKDKINIFPNPASSFIKVNYEAQKLGEVTLTISNLSGQNVLVQNHQAQKNNQWTISPRDWPKGVYSLTIESLDGVYTERLYVE